jgi:alpha-N-acetylglucosamine transferase
MAEPQPPQQAGEEEEDDSAPTSTSTRRHAYVTLVTTEGFVTGARVLLHSLRAACRSLSEPPPLPTAPCRPALVVLVTASVSASARATLQPLCDEVREVEALPNPFQPHVQGWVDSGFTKLWVWAMTEYERVVYVDADCLVLQDLGEVRASAWRG